MKSQTSIVAKQVRLQQWADQIKDCQSRPAGVNVETWCQEHSITKANYYYRLKCVRKAYLEQIKSQSPEFIELPALSAQIQPSLKKESFDSRPAAILHGPNNISVELSSTATPDFLFALIGAFNHVK